MKMAKHSCTLLHDEIQSPPPWSAGQPRGESTKKHRDAVITPRAHASPHKPSKMFAQLHSSSAPPFCPYSHPAVLPFPAITDKTLRCLSHAMQQVNAPELFALFQNQLVSNNAKPTACVHALRRPHCASRTTLPAT